MPDHILPTIPVLLRQRIEPNAPAPRPGKYVVYWMRIAARATENPALDVALRASEALGLPMFVYHALSQRYHYASDRIHAFIMQGARDVQHALQQRNIGYVFHLQTPADDASHLEAIAGDAALVVADYMPVAPLLGWTKQIATLAPLWNVDASLIAPLWQFHRSVDRAFEFRAMAAPVWKRLVSQPYAEQPSPAGGAFVPKNLPFTPVDLQTADLAMMIAGCDIDHSIAPVAHTVGGSIAAQQRWELFSTRKLARYHKERNDPLRDGHSRMSAYLHFGHISPFRVARDCAAAGNEGSDKYLDELLVWRELAWHFCWHHQQALVDADSTFSLIPSWAKQTLAARESDPRPALYVWDQLARGQTDDALWNACQRSLLTHGEMHNNVRMTWGKAFLQWTANAKTALRLMIDLNHRYALDGRDPASYGGLLWCLGALDRPFTPEQPITGMVRGRDLTHHAHRLDVVQYASRMATATIAKPLRVAVVGAGIAGAAAARTLVDAGHHVTVFDKGRGVGGRMATRRGDNAAFDHGAQYFTVKDERFARVCRSLWQQGVLAPWTTQLRTGRVSSTPDATPTVRLVPVPGMSAMMQRLLHNIHVVTATEVAPVPATRSNDHTWALTDTHGNALGAFDALVVAAPAPQSRTLLVNAAPLLAATAAAATYAPCFALMLSFEQPLVIRDAPDALFIDSGPLSWAARNNSKPGRSPNESWVIHASAAWSREHLEQVPANLQEPLTTAFFAALDIPPTAPLTAAVHRWRYALVENALQQDCLFEASLNIAAAGDWCLGGRIEQAYLSGVAAAARINAHASLQPTKPRSPYQSQQPPRQMSLM